MAANTFLKQLLDYEMEHDFANNDEVVSRAKKCIPHIQCLGCLDTRHVLYTSESFFGGTYEEFTCPACQNGRKDRLDSHHQIYHAQVNGRQVPYNGGGNTGYSRVVQLYQIYKNEYEQHDLFVEEEKRRKKREEEIKREEAERLSPKWEYMDNRELKQEITSVDVTVNISELVKDVTKLMAITAGNLAALPGFLQALEVTLKYYWSNESTTNSSFYKTKDDQGEEVFIKFEYNKVTKDTKGGLGIFRAKGQTHKEWLTISYFIAKPTNDAAKRICTDLMNQTIQHIVKRLG